MLDLRSEPVREAPGLPSKQPGHIMAVSRLHAHEAQGPFEKQLYALLCLAHGSGPQALVYCQADQIHAAAGLLDVEAPHPRAGHISTISPQRKSGLRSQYQLPSWRYTRRLPRVRMRSLISERIC